jgi:3-deoxy-7-phosphoheptulonate synthase
MLIVRLASDRDLDIARAANAMNGHGSEVHRVRLGPDTLILFEPIGPTKDLCADLRALPGVAEACVLDTPYILSARKAAGDRTRVRVGADLVVGGTEFVVMAGPCAVETQDQVSTAARAVRDAGARIIRGGAYKPRTSPFGFQGRGEAGLDILGQARHETGLPIVSEVMSPGDVDGVTAKVDILQVGMRNALNYPLLTAIGHHPDRPPVLLKCGIGTPVTEFLCAADYILAGGNANVILCLRGTVGLSGDSRATLNIADIPALRGRTHLPIIVDPSHAAGRRDFVPSMAAAALAAGADGLLIEVHDRPDAALSDGAQSLTPPGFSALMRHLRRLAPVMGRTMIDPVGPEPQKNGHPFTDLCMEAPPTSDSGAHGTP